MTKPIVAGSLLLLAALGVAVAGERQPVYRTPQDVYKAAKKAGIKGDMRGFCKTLTDDSRDFFAGTMASMALTIEDAARSAPKEKREKTLAQLKPFLDVLARYGVTAEPLKKLKGQKTARDPEGMMPLLKQLLAPVKDRCAFFAEMVAAARKPGEKEARMGFFDSKGELKDLAIEGDTARAVVVSTKDGKEKRDPIAFRQVAGGWKIDLMQLLPGKNGKKGSPPAQ